MPMLTTVEIGRPVAPCHCFERTFSAKALILSSTACTSRLTSWPSTTRPASAGARSAVCSTARSSLTLMCAPVYMASMRSRSPARSARATSRPMVSPVARCLA